jgi:hypothetical protein
VDNWCDEDEASVNVIHATVSRGTAAPIVPDVEVKGKKKKITRGVERGAIEAERMIAPQSGMRPAPKRKIDDENINPM